MILIAGVNNYLHGSADATAFIGGLLGLIALMLVFFLYVNRKWCFTTTKAFKCSDENVLSSKYVHKLALKRPYENTSSDSEEEILTRLRVQRSCSLQNTSFQRYGIDQIRPLTQNFCFDGLQQVTVVQKDESKDPLGIAERGKVGVPSSHSECSSNDSVEASVNSTNGITVSEPKDFKPIALDISEISTTFMKETRIDDLAGRRFSANSIKYHRMSSQEANILDQESIAQTNTNQDCIVVMSQEQLFDTSDLKSLKSEFDSRLYSPVAGRGGSIEISLFYDAPIRKMTVHVLQARGIPSREAGQQTHTQVRLLMLPIKKQKHKTKIRSGENPQFMESFLIHRINPEEVNNLGLRIRVYGCERMRKERLIGEAIVSFATIDLELETNLWLPLEPRTNSSIIGSSIDLMSLTRSDSTGSTTSMQHGGVPELLIGLAYNGTTGRLNVEIVKGSHFRNLTLNKAPDTYVKLCLVSSIGQEMAKAKSSTRRGQPNPLFKETFSFQVALFQLNDVTLMVSVYAKCNMKRNEMVGWFSLGLNSSGPEEMAHWVDMRDTAKGELLARWHILMNS